MNGAVIYNKKSKRGVNKGRGYLVSRLDQVVSKIVRLRDKKCVLCGSTYMLTAGHVFSRRSVQTRWDLMNVFCQCWQCNLKHVYDTQPYFDWYVREFGLDEFDDLRRRFNSLNLVLKKSYGLEEKLTELRQVLKELEKQ